MNLSRRDLLQSAVAASAAAGLTGVALAEDAPVAEAAAASPPPVRYCFNTATLRGQKLPLPDLIRLVAEAGYDGIEPWIGEIQAFQNAGGKLADLRKLLADQGLTVESAIGFARWISDDATERKEALEQLKQEMELVRALGGTRIAAPPAGATREPGLDLAAAARRFHAACEVGRAVGVRPQLELWGFSKNLSRLGEVAYVAVESGHPDALLLLDIYHIYKGGSDFAGLRLLNGAAMEMWHLNDYPADPPRETIGDRDRVYPGQGIADVPLILRMLFASGFAGVLSLELFNPAYYRQRAERVLRDGLESMRSCVAKATE